MERVLHIIGKMDRAGAETMVMNLYRTIDRKCFQFDFVVFTKDKGDFDVEILSLGGKIYTLVESNPILRMLALKNLLIKHPEYKIVHTHTLFSNAFHLWAAKIANVPYRIAHSHNTSASSKGKLIDFIYRNVSRKIINKYATHFIGCGNAAAKFLFPTQKEVMFLPNSIETKKFAKIGKTHKDYLNNEFNVDESYLKIIQVGRLQHVKNPFFSIKIAEKLKEKNVKFKMFFVGQGDLYNTLNDVINIKNLSSEVFLLGVRSDIPELMAGADVLLMPSLHEGFPVVLVESQSVGIPALIADTISPEVDLDVNLIEFESLDYNVIDWANKLIALKTKEKINQELRLQKLEVQGFDIHSSAKLLINLYNSMK